MPDLQQPTDVSEATPINRILAQAAAAAFANRRDEAHELLQQAIRQAPSSPEVWLACAALAGDPIERLAYLERACALNPTDTRARTLAGRARVQVINQLTEQGIAAVRDKNMGAARQHFAEIVRLDPTHEVTWLRLAALAESPEEQVALIKQVLRINPANDKARATLIEAEKQLAQTHLRQASAEIEAGQYANARAALRRSLQLDNASEDAWSLMALIAEDADERQNAADRLDALRAAQLVAVGAGGSEPEPEPVLTVGRRPRRCAGRHRVADVPVAAGPPTRRRSNCVAATRSGRRRRPAWRGCAAAQGPLLGARPRARAAHRARPERARRRRRADGLRAARRPASGRRRSARGRTPAAETVIVEAPSPDARRPARAPRRCRPSLRALVTDGALADDAGQFAERRQAGDRRTGSRRADDPPPLDADSAAEPAPARCCPTSPPRRPARTGPARSARRCARRPSTSARPAAA